MINRQKFCSLQMTLPPVYLKHQVASHNKSFSPYALAFKTFWIQPNLLYYSEHCKFALSLPLCCQTMLSVKLKSPNELRFIFPWIWFWCTAMYVYICTTSITNFQDNLLNEFALDSWQLMIFTMSYSTCIACTYVSIV